MVIFDYFISNSKRCSLYSSSACCFYFKD